MTIKIYPAGLAALANGGIDLDTTDLRVQAIKTAGAAYNGANDNLDDIVAGDRTGTAVALANKTIITPGSPANSRALDADDTPMGTLADAGDRFIIYKHTGVESTSTLLAYLDGFSWTAGQNVTAVWSANGIIYLSSAT